MGYDLHITRKTDWSADDGPSISESEWAHVVDEDAELSPDHETSCEGFVFAEWNHQGGALAWHRGEILAKNPEKPLIRKMIAIAQRLNATVQGDDGELYTNMPELTDAPSRQEVSFHRWQRVMRIVGPIIMALSVGWVLFKIIRWISG